VYALWGEPLAEAAAHIARVKEAAARHGRDVRISLSLRPILAGSDAEAWDRARQILATIQDRSGGRTPPPPANVGSQRLLAAAARGEVQDRCLYLPLATASGARGNSTALVGSVETVAQAMLDYHDIGVTTFLIRGYDPFDDAVDYGRLVPLVREQIAQREQQTSRV
jgi:alkanesulfonate monooxygenase